MAIGRHVKIAVKSEDFPKLQPIAIIWFVGSIVCDVIITAAMLYYLLTKRTGYRDTDLLIHTIARGVIETGLATTTIVILDAIFFFRLVRGLSICYNEAGVDTEFHSVATH